MRRGFSALTENDHQIRKRYDQSGNSITDSMYDPEIEDDEAKNDDTELSIDLDQVEGWYDEVKQNY